MVIDGLLVLVGLALLTGGGEALVRGSSGIALFARISPAVIGLTIVAAGTSMPELVVSVQSAIQGSPGLAVGNVVGSNIFNIACILGLTALVRPLRIQGNTVRLEWPVMFLAALLLFLLSRDQTLDRMEGGFFLASLVAFMAYAVWIGRRATADAEEPEPKTVATASFGKEGWAGVSLNLAAVVLGVCVLALGSTALVSGAVGVASGLGVSETVIGLTIVAAGTSTPELVTSLLAVRRGQDDIAVGNVVGSNIFNVLGIAGLASVIHPLPVPEVIILRDNWWMVGASLLLFPLMKTGMRIRRVEGAFLLAGYMAYVGLLIAAAETA